MNNKAFTLIEILVVGIIIAGFTLWAVPSFNKMFNQADTRNTKTNLMLIYGFQQDYKYKHGSYASVTDNSPDLNVINSMFSTVLSNPDKETYDCNGNICQTQTVKVSLNTPIVASLTMGKCANGDNPCLK